MKRIIFFLCLLSFIFSCKNKKKEELVQYNDRIVNMMEQADRIMKSWTSSDMMQNYDVNKEAAKSQIVAIQDSLKNVVPVSKDDTLRLSGISILTGYMQSFGIYDTIYMLLTDSVYLKEDSIRVQTLLQTNKNMIDQESSSFAEIQKRFAKRYELDFMQ